MSISHSTRHRAGLVLALLTVLALTGCATCREHPAVCTVAALVVTSAIVASTQGHHHDRSQPMCEQQVTPNACRAL
jgi:hypothetical protein